MSARDRLRPGVFTHVYLLSKVQARYERTDRNVRQSLRAAGFNASLVKNNVRRVRRLVERLTWSPEGSAWSDYADCNTYHPGDRERKREFVRRAAGSRRWSLVWDLGCNTGEYSHAVAEHAERVVALDADHLAVERLYCSLKAENHATILPLVGDIANPSPGLGWRGLERRTLVDRGRPDLILVLALVHHLAITRNVPLSELVGWLASFQADLIVEFVAPGDPMVQRLLRNKAVLGFGYTQERFEASLSRHFLIASTERLGSGTRTMYYVRPRNPR